MEHWLIFKGVIFKSHSMFIDVLECHMKLPLSERHRLSWVFVFFSGNDWCRPKTSCWLFLSSADTATSYGATACQSVDKLFVYIWESLLVFIISITYAFKVSLTVTRMHAFLVYPHSGKKGEKNIAPFAFCERLWPLHVSINQSPRVVKVWLMKNPNTRCFKLQNSPYALHGCVH